MIAMSVVTIQTMMEMETSESDYFYITADDDDNDDDSDDIDDDDNSDDDMDERDSVYIISNDDGDHLPNSMESDSSRIISKFEIYMIVIVKEKQHLGGQLVNTITSVQQDDMDFTK